MATEFLSERESTLLGQEFLTWLWFVSEVGGGTFPDAEGKSFSVHMAERVSVAGGEGENRETVAVSGPHAQLREARVGVSAGKKVTKAQLLFEQDGENWSVQIKAEDFALGTLKTSKIDRSDKDDADGIFLEQMYLLEKCVGFMDALYGEFLRRRLDSARWQAEVAGLREWLASEG